MEKYRKGEFAMLLAGQIASGMLSSGKIVLNDSLDTRELAKNSLEVAREIINQGSTQSNSFGIFDPILG